MHGEIITTGTELLTGQVADANAGYAARRLHQSCLKLTSITILGDGGPLLGETLQRAVGRSRFVIVTGGLGPTDDDLTVAAAAEALGLRLFEDPALLARIRRCLGERGLPWRERYTRLALLPQGATVLDPGGAACGFSLKCGDAWLFFLPGVPREMRLLFDAYVLPALVAAAGEGGCLVERTLRFPGMPELRLQEVVSHLSPRFPDVQVGFYPDFPETRLTLTLAGGDREALEHRLREFLAALRCQLDDPHLGTEDAPLEALVGGLLRTGRLTLAVAESCSGGFICHRVTNVPGSSDYFMGGVVTYSNRAKQDLLRVPWEILEVAGAVSPETARAMAQGVRALFHADLGLAATGIAGPTGGSAAKPVGTVHLGLARPGGVETESHLFHGGREQIKALTAQTALHWLYRELAYAQDLSRH
ncbi:MAG: CinA family nicotinamide mononucleotide deamidase-related protein [Deltaproteobacteria bacterium]|nr:CinA family nicotinamide mononucleotide deamidase-related protein [Deltaproteobacteria bacterium]